MLNKNTNGFHAQNWTQAVAQLSQHNTDFVLVTLLGSAGSTPRPQGTKMVVTADDIYDTVGGGHLEFKVIAQARALLVSETDSQKIEHFPLGASLGQCCGGSVSVLFEKMVTHVPVVHLHGAGHVAHALVSVLSQLPLQVNWVDSRADLFPEAVPANVTVTVDDAPEETVKHAQAGDLFVVLTHNHQLDFLLTEKILKRNDSAFLGVIGSQTKAERFKLRLQHRGFSDEQVSAMTCPVGLPEVTGKRPMEVAVSIAGQLIAQYQQQLPPKQTREGLQWKSLKQELKSTTLLPEGVNSD
jgi:xanthine dehydrogenase accessory factor